MAAEPLVDTETFAQLLDRRAERNGGGAAIREKRRGIWRTLSWQELARQTGSLAAALAERGLARLDHVALIGENRSPLFIAMAAAHRLGAVAVPLHPDADAEEIAAWIEAIGAVVVFAENQEQVDKLLHVRPRCPSVRLIVYDDDRGMRTYAQADLVAFQELADPTRALGSGSRAPAGPHADDPAFVFFTSGLAGPVEGVVYRHGALISRARAMAVADNIGEADTTLAYFPPAWAYQTLFSYALGMVSGQCICCAESSDTLLDDMREIAPTRILTTPRMLDGIVAQVSQRMEGVGGLGSRLYRSALASAHHGARDRVYGREPTLIDRLAGGLYEVVIYGPLRDALGMSRIRAAYCTGDVLDPAMLGFFRALGINLKQLYGSTECGIVLTMHRDGAVAPGTVGTALDGVEIAVAPEGEILVRCRDFTTARLGDPKAAAPVSDGSGWMRTGDIGRLGADGDLTVIGRVEDMGRLLDGTSFAPRPIESRISVSPFVREAVVIGQGRDMVCALIDINADTVGQWADRQRIAFTGHADLAAHDAVCELIADAISEVNADLARDPARAALQVRRFVLLPEALSAEGGLLTLTGKLRRAAVAGRFAPLIDALFAGRAEAPIETAFAAGAGHEGAGSLGLKIREARIVPTAVAQRAA